MFPVPAMSGSALRDRHMDRCQKGAVLGLYLKYLDPRRRAVPAEQPGATLSQAEELENDAETRAALLKTPDF